MDQAEVEHRLKAAAQSVVDTLCGYREGEGDLFLLPISLGYLVQYAMTQDGRWPQYVAADDIVPESLQFGDDGRVELVGTLNYLHADAAPRLPWAEPVRGYLQLDFARRRLTNFAFKIGTGRDSRHVERIF